MTFVDAMLFLIVVEMGVLVWLVIRDGGTVITRLEAIIDRILFGVGAVTAKLDKIITLLKALNPQPPAQQLTLKFTLGTPVNQ